MGPLLYRAVFQPIADASVLVLLIASVALHFALTVLFILSEFWISISAPPAKRGFVLGIYATVLSLGFAGGPWLFAQIGSAGFMPFGVTFALVMLATIPVLAAWREGPVIERAERLLHEWCERHAPAVAQASAVARHRVRTFFLVCSRYGVTDESIKGSTCNPERPVSSIFHCCVRWRLRGTGYI